MVQKKIPETVTLKDYEVRALKYILIGVHEGLRQLPTSGEDLVGEDTWYALRMMEDKLKGVSHELNWYIDESSYEGDGGEDTVDTVDEWLEAYSQEEE